MIKQWEGKKIQIETQQIISVDLTPKIMNAFIRGPKKGRKAFYNMAAKQAGVSLNEFIITAIEEKMKNETPEIYNNMMEQQEVYLQKK